MNKHKIIVIILTIYSLNVIAQDELNNDILKHYYNVDIPFFTKKNTQYEDRPLYKAFKNWVKGNEILYIIYLEEAQRKESNNKKISKLLFKAYVKTGQANKAFELNKSQKLGYDKNRNTDYAKSIFGKPRLQMNSDSTTVKFDDFYFKAIVNKSDTLKVMLDTGAPGISINKSLVEKYNWEKDTTYYDDASIRMLNVTYKRYPVLIPNLSIGDAHFYNIPATFDNLSEEDLKKMNVAGVEEFDIIMGLDVFYGLIDGIDFNYMDGELTLIKSINQSSNVKPNFMRVSGKPAIQFKVNNSWEKAFIDTGSPKHVLTKDVIKKSNVFEAREGNYGNFTYGLSTLLVDEILNLSNTELEFADYGGRIVDEKFNIVFLFGTFKDRNLSFDLKNRVVRLK